MLVWVAFEVVRKTAMLCADRIESENVFFNVIVH